jgi:exopolysaccharide biosynthesis protein
MAPIAALPSPPAAIIVQVDVRRCDITASSPMGRKLSLPQGAVAINANYFWQGTPIGVLMSHGTRTSTLPLTKTRAVLVIQGKKATVHVVTPTEAERSVRTVWKGATVIQAGPRIVHQGQITPRSEIAKEKVSADVLRRTNHTVIGITKEGKLLLCFIRGQTVSECARIVQQAGAVEALNLDGGGSASLRYQGQSHGRVNPYTALIVKPLR